MLAVTRIVSHSQFFLERSFGSPVYTELSCSNVMPWHTLSANANCSTVLCYVESATWFWLSLTLGIVNLST